MFLLQRLWLLPALVGLVITIGGTSHAALIAHEGFNYDAGANLHGSNGGSGWSTAWNSAISSGGQAQIQAPGATYPGLSVSGNKAFVQRANQNSRTLSAGNLGTGATADSTVWISFIGERTGANNIRLFRMAFYDATDVGLADPKFLVGEGSNDADDMWNVLFTGSDVEGNAHVDSGVAITEESLLLMRIDYHDGAADDLRLWVNPDLSAGEPNALSSSYAGGSIGEYDLAFGIVSLRAGTLSSGNEGQGYFDEIRIGTTFGSVVPEPASMMLAAAGFLGLGIVIRRRKR